MKAFKCMVCGNVSYSSADLDRQINPGCPYCGAGKQFIKQEDTDVVYNINDLRGRVDERTCC